MFWLNEKYLEVILLIFGILFVVQCKNSIKIHQKAKQLFLK